jgi:bile acid-coenzyme A ligase
MTTHAEVRPATWPDRVDALAADHPDGLALTTTARGGERRTWAELAAASRLAGGWLAERGAAPGTVVAVALPNGADHVTATIGAWRTGATVLPLRPDLPEAERARLLALADPVVVVTPETAPEPGTGTASGTASDTASDTASLPGARVADPGWLIASGGSTGAPKLIASSVTTAFREGPGGPLIAAGAAHAHPVHLVCSPLYHTQGFSLLHHLLVQDGRIVLTDHFDAEQVLDLVETERVEFVALVPTMLIRLLRSPTLADRDLSSLQRVALGAGATPEWAVRRWIDLLGPERLVLGYGSSEGVCSAQIRGDEWLRRPGSVGRPADTQVRVGDAAGAAVPVGTVGELYFRSPRTARYVGRVERRTLPGGWLSIGDLGRVDADGYLYIADRRTDMVVTGGVNVYVSEVEAALLEHPEVTDAAVVGLPDAEWGRRVHAVVTLVPTADRAHFAATLRDWCRGRLTGPKIPRTVEVVDDLGRAESGKLNRSALVAARVPDSGAADPT